MAEAQVQVQGFSRLWAVAEAQTVQGGLQVEGRHSLQFVGRTEGLFLHNSISDRTI